LEDEVVAKQMIKRKWCSRNRQNRLLTLKQVKEKKRVCHNPLFGLKDTRTKYLFSNLPATFSPLYSQVTIFQYNVSLYEF